MNRSIWEKITGFISVDEYPSLPCPYCMSQSLSIETETISYRKAICEDTSAIIAEGDNERMDMVANAFQKNKFLGVLLGVGVVAGAEFKEPAKFICFFKCLNCEGYVSATGTSQYPSNVLIQNAKKPPLIKVEYFSPPVPVFNINSNVPKSVKDETLQSFNHFHSDLCSSGSKLRRSIERLCEELGFKENNLHRSIEALKKEHPNEASLLYPLKLLGNEATHSESINYEDLLDAFEVQKFVLGIFDRIEAEKLAEEMANRIRLKFEK